MEDSAAVGGVLDVSGRGQDATLNIDSSSAQSGTGTMSTPGQHHHTSDSDHAVPTSVTLPIPPIGPLVTAVANLVDTDDHSAVNGGGGGSISHTTAPDASSPTSLHAQEAHSTATTLDKGQPLDGSSHAKILQKRERIYLGIIMSLQKELCRVKALVSDWRPLHVTDESLRVCSVFVDPTVNLEVKELRLQLSEYEGEIRKLKDELQAATFAAESIMGRRLISKCRTLQAENGELGRLISDNQLDPLHQQVAALQKQNQFYKHQITSLQELSSDLDEENERLTQQLSSALQRQKSSYLSSDRHGGTRGANQPPHNIHSGHIPGQHHQMAPGGPMGQHHSMNMQPQQQSQQTHGMNRGWPPQTHTGSVPHNVGSVSPSQQQMPHHSGQWPPPAHPMPCPAPYSNREGKDDRRRDRTERPRQQSPDRGGGRSGRSRDDRKRDRGKVRDRDRDKPSERSTRPKDDVGSRGGDRHSPPSRDRRVRGSSSGRKDSSRRSLGDDRKRTRDTLTE